MRTLLFLLISIPTLAQTGSPDLKAYSVNMNKSLPEIFDHATKLMTTTVENNNFYYHFMLKATREEFAGALPKVQNQVLKTICTQSRERPILVRYKANLIYRYENDKGQSLGEFMIQPSHCSSSKP